MWSIRSVPLLAFSKAPYEIEPSVFSIPNSSSSYLLLSNYQHYRDTYLHIMRVSEFL